LEVILWIIPAIGLEAKSETVKSSTGVHLMTGV
jgi:hypothetical protein